MKHTIILRMFIFCTMATTACCFQTTAGKPVNALIITGQNNHNWEVSHQVIKHWLFSFKFPHQNPVYNSPIPSYIPHALPTSFSLI